MLSFHARSSYSEHRRVFLRNKKRSASISYRLAWYKWPKKTKSVARTLRMEAVSGRRGGHGGRWVRPTMAAADDAACARRRP